MRSHLDPDNLAPVDDREGYQTLVQKEPHPCAVNLLQMLLKRIDRINLNGLIWYTVPSVDDFVWKKITHISLAVRFANLQ